MAELFGVLQPAVKFIGVAIAIFGMVQLGMESRCRDGQAHEARCRGILGKRP